MQTSLPTAIASRLERAAVYNGFDRKLQAIWEWLAFARTKSPLCIWLGMTVGGSFALAVSQHNVAVTLGTVGEPFGETLPTGAVGARGVPDIPTIHRLIHRLIHRAFQLSKTIPDESLHVFVARTATLPRMTEAERLVVQRVGQDIFRQGLLDYWEGRCAITGLAVPELLRASHTKPWAASETDTERRDVYNGLLLAPHLAAAFDQGFVTTSDSGELIVSASIDTIRRDLLGFEGRMFVDAPLNGQSNHLRWHREHAFKNALKNQPPNHNH